MARPARLVALPLAAVAALALAQGVRETVQVGLVSIRLEVRDRDGKPISDLAASDVRLKVDGKDVPIEGLDRVSSAVPVPPGASHSTTEAGAPEAAAATASPSPASDSWLLILVDDASSNPLDRHEVYRQLESFLGRKSPGTHVMVQRFDGTLHMECPWTTDLDAALQTTKKMSKRMENARMPSPSELRDEVRRGRKARDVQSQVDLASRRSFQGVLHALLQFPEVKGRRGLVWITDGTPLVSPFDLAMLFSDSDVNGREERAMRAEALRGAGETSAANQIESTLKAEALTTFSDVAGGQSVSWYRLMAQITSKAADLDIAFYPLDSEDPARGTNPGVTSKWEPRSMPGVAIGGASLPTTSGLAVRVAVVDSMNTLADLTGGQAILVPRKAADALADVAGPRAGEYVLSFRDPFPDDPKYHTVAVTIGREGVRASHRKGYRVRSEEERILDSVVAHLAHPPNGRNPLDARAEMAVLREDGGRKIVEMRLEYTPVEAPGDTAAERDLDVWAICSDDAGNRAKPIHRQVRATRMPPNSRAAYRDSFQLGLPPGPYTWSLALKDRPTGAISYVVVKKTV